MKRTRKSGSEQYRRKIRNRRILVLSVFLVVVLLCVCLFTPLFAITEISVTGNTLLSAETIIADSGIEKGENVFRISKRKAKQSLTASPYIESVEIKRKFLARVLIEIDEAKQDIIVDTPREFIVTTVDGRVLEKAEDVTKLAAPIVYGISVKEAEPAKQIKAEDDAQLATQLQRVGCFYNTNFWADIDEFYVSDMANFMLIMKSGMKVTFGSVHNIEELQHKINMMSQILPQVKQTAKSYLDLTTEKGYFGEYTDEELEEMKRLEENGGILSGKTKEESKQEDAQAEEEKSGEKKEE